MKKFFVFIVLTCLLGNRALAQTRSASNTSFTPEVYDFSNIEATTTTVWSGYQEFGPFSQTRFDIANTQFNVSEGDIIRVSFSPANNNTPGTGGGPEGRFKPYQGWSELIAVNNIRYGNGYYEATITGTATVNGNTVNVVDYINNNGLGIQAAYMTITSVQVISMGSLTWNGNNLVAFAGNSLPKADRISVDNTSGYSIGVSNANNCSYLQSTTQGRLFYINNLNVGDVVRIWCAGECRILTDNTATHDSNNPLVWNFNDPDPSWNGQQQAPWGGQMYYDREINNRDGVQLQETFNYDVSNPSPTANELKIVNNHDNGTLVIRLANRYAGIIKVEIDAVQTTPRYDYDASLEVYDMYETLIKTVNGQVFDNTNYTADESAEFKLNNKYGYYLKFTNNDLSLNERIAIDNTNTWTFAHGIQAPSNWSNLSICNLREGDRVLIYYSGDAPIFSSNGSNGDYTGNAAYKDTWNDGMLDTNEGDHIITKGDPVEYTYCRKEGTFGNEEGTNHIWLYTSYPYVMMENGHLDLSLSNGNHTRIVKIKIYSDHQAMMVDDYDNETYTYTAYFNITGELQAKEHIVPGGLEVHVGNDNADQHANVVFSKEGPVSYVKAVDGYKIPGIYRDTNGQIHNNFNLANEAPTTGTYYRFIPEANGQMTIRFKATSLNYYRWDLKADDIYYNTDTGGGWTTEFDRSNEWPMDRSCPYYLMVQDGDSYTSASFKIDDSSNSSTGAFKKNNEYVTLTLDVQAGKTYYLYGTWDQQKGNGDDNSIGGTDANLSERPACGIAELLWVKFNPENKVYPLAKWVPNDTKAVNENNKVPNPDDPSMLEGELATVIGYVGATITVKKMSGNITACRPYIYREKDEQGNYKQEGKLMIDGIQFAKDKNPGGTILIKIGDPNLKTSPLYALTIAYSADPKYNGENGLSGNDSRGHIWDLTTNSLYGMKWDLTDDAYVKSQAPQYSTTFETSTGGYATPTPYGTYFKDYYANEASIANFSNADDVLDWFKTNNKINTGSLLEEEIDYPDQHDNIRSDWMFRYNLVYGDELFDPIFLNKYDMEGDNADMIWDTEGTVIRTSANQSVIFNEFTGTDIHSSAKDPNRYVGIIEGGEFRIPWLMPNDRVIIYMGTGTGRYADEVIFNIRGAYDAVHNEISESDDYIVGGSHWDGADGDKNYRGCYHFFATGDKNNAGKPADMVFKMKEGSLCKIYKIQIYRGDRIITNEVVGETINDKFLLWSRAKDPNDPNDEATKGSASNWTLQYFGKDQKLADNTNSVNNDIVAQTGHITKTLITETDATKATYNTFTYPHTQGEIGTIRVRAKDMEKNMKYVADYGEHNVTIAYQETQKYPYTWDFMDMTGYKRSDEEKGNIACLFQPEDKYEAEKPDWFDTDATWDASYEKTSKDLSLWETQTADETYYLRLNSQALAVEHPMDNIFESAMNYETATNKDGNQVWANHTVVPETQGLWFSTEDNNPANGGQLIISDDGMQLNGSSSWPYRIVVPNVPAGKAVYLRMRNVIKTPHFVYNFEGNGNSQVYGPVEVSGTSTVINNVKYADYVFAIMNNESTKRHLTFSFGGYLLKKLAVSTDFKKLNIRGWATESRDHVIDPELTAYMTGKNIETCIVTGVNYADKKINLTRVYTSSNTSSATNTTSKSYVMSSLEDGDKGACILHNEAAQDLNATDGEVKILNNGFHLFVPDMHDYGFDEENKYVGEKTITDKTSMLVAQVSNTNGTKSIKSSEGDYTNYALTYQYYKLDAEGKQYGSKITGDEAFYRIAYGGASSSGNQGYLPLLTDYVNPNSNLYGTNPNSGAKFSIVFDEEFVIDNSGIATQINEVESSGSVTTESFYNLNGQKMNGKPTQKGLYIVNGKKVLVK